jgi:hypothetical protein
MTEIEDNNMDHVITEQQLAHCSRPVALTGAISTQQLHAATAHIPVAMALHTVRFALCHSSDMQTWLPNPTRMVQSYNHGQWW